MPRPRRGGISPPAAGREEDSTDRRHRRHRRSYKDSDTDRQGAARIFQAFFGSPSFIQNQAVARPKTGRSRPRTRRRHARSESYEVVFVTAGHERKSGGSHFHAQHCSHYSVLRYCGQPLSRTSFSLLYVSVSGVLRVSIFVRRRQTYFLNSVNGSPPISAYWRAAATTAGIAKILPR